MMYKGIELVVLFFAIPASFLLPVNPICKVAFVLLGIIYIGYIWFFKEKEKLNVSFKTNKKYLKTIGIRFLFIAVISLLFIYITDPSKLFNIVKNNKLVWITFMGVYLVFSVIPQEFLYRTFFFRRYRLMIANQYLFILFNAFVFSFAHIWFKSILVLGFTFIGGILFATTYNKTNSFLFICLEHTLYGNWLYTVGFGEDFMFPIE